MPVTKSAKKQLRQSLKKRARNFPLRSKVKTYVKKELQFIKDGKLEEAEKFLREAYKTIDTALKNNLIHRNNAARKKSKLAKALSAAKAKKK